MKHYARPRQNTGFTLIEVMIVVVIISLLVGMLAPNIVGRVDEARVETAKSDISTMMQALELYRLDNRQYPTTQQGLDSLLAGAESSKRAEGYLRSKAVPKDPWGNEYLYVSPGRDSKYDLYSYGADGQEGGEDDNTDIGSWDFE